MSELRTTAQEEAEDLFFGQEVIIFARWLIIGAGTFFVLWSADQVDDLINSILPLIVLIGMNFFLHGRFLMDKPANRMLLLILAIFDLVVITAIIAFGQEKGLNSEFFIFYYPIILSFAFVFPPRMAFSYTALILVAYGITTLMIDDNLFVNTENLEELTVRLITMAAMWGLATFYWRIQRGRRRETLSE